MAGDKEKKKYKYESPTVSMWFTLYWKPMYTWLVLKTFPNWVHANVVTLLGFTCAFSSFALIGLMSDWFQHSTVPSWAWIVSGIAFWGYMVADNCDGIQARRLKISSPIGEMMDHGVDALLTTTAPQVLAFAFLGNDSEDPALNTKRQYQLAMVLMFQYCFYLTHIISVLSGKLLLGYKYLSIDELFMMYGLVLITEGLAPGFLGGVSVFGVSLASVLIGSMLVVPGIVTTLQVVRLVMKDTEHSVGELFRIAVLPIALVLGAQVYFAPYDFYWWLTWTPVYGLVLLRLVIRRMKQDKGPLGWHMVLALVALGRQFLPTLMPQLTTTTTHAVVAGLSWTLYLVFVSELLLRMKREYHIPTLFTVPAENQRNANA